MKTGRFLKLTEVLGKKYTAISTQFFILNDFLLI